MSEHTLGPWHVWHETHVMGDDRLVAACGGYSNNVKPAYDENAANARLIAAAPDMLEALKYITEQMPDHGSEADAARAAWRMLAIARDTIRKAEGKEP